jgi:hypothetical protein
VCNAAYTAQRYLTFEQSQATLIGKAAGFSRTWEGCELNLLELPRPSVVADKVRVLRLQIGIPVGREELAYNKFHRMVPGQW